MFQIKKMGARKIPRHFQRTMDLKVWHFCARKTECDIVLWDDRVHYNNSKRTANLKTRLIITYTMHSPR